MLHLSLNNKVFNWAFIQSTKKTINYAVALLFFVGVLPVGLFAQETGQVVLNEVSSSLKTKSDVKSEMKDDEEGILTQSLEEREFQKQNKIGEWMRQASVAARAGEVKTAEEYYLQVLSFDIKPQIRREALLSMAKMFEKTKDFGKQAAVLEKYTDAFPDDPALPQVYIKLGILYRSLGLYKLALARLYSVLNYSLKIDPSQIETYRRLSIRAQMEIADTNFDMGEYKAAISFYSKMRLLELLPEERAHALFQTANCYYMLKDDARAATNFESYARDHYDNIKAPEAMFMLSQIYSRQGRKEEASRQVLELLKRQKVRTAADNDQWIYWQKAAGEKMANGFFENADYSPALSVYQAMLPLDDTIAWRWPILYQIGLCFEKLSMGIKSQEMYKLITDTPEKEREKVKEDMKLNSFYEMAKWRQENIDWRRNTKESLEKLLDKSSN